MTHRQNVKQQRGKATAKAVTLERVQHIAVEAHTMGRLYAAGGEKLNPVAEWGRVRDMAERWLRLGPPFEPITRSKRRGR